MLELRTVALPGPWGPARVAQVLDARGGTFVLLTAERSEVYRLDGDHLALVGGPQLPPIAPRVTPMSALGDGTLSVVDRDTLHLFDGEAWTRVLAPARLVAAWGPDAWDLLAIDVDGAIHERRGDGPWKPAAMPDAEMPSRVWWRTIDGAAGDVYAVGNDATHSCIAHRRHGVWRLDGCGAHHLFAVRVLGPAHAAAWTTRGVWLNRGGGWDMLPIWRRRELIGEVDFVCAIGGHTAVGGRRDREDATQLWAQLGNLRRFRGVARGVDPSDRGGWWEGLPGGRLALCGGARLYLSPEGFVLAHLGEPELLDPIEDRPRTVDVADAGLDAYAIDRRPVSNREWARFLRDTGLPAPSHWAAGEIPPDREDHPVVGVSAHEAERYATTRGMRLPTEAEWAAAMEGAEALVARPWKAPQGPVHQRTRAMTGFAERTPRGLERVGMVWEWTSTPSSKGGFVVRGGPWRDRIAPPSVDNRSFETGPAPDVGFRCARSLGVPTPPTRGAPYR